MLDGFRQIRAFLAVARLGSFVRASAELHVSQPALTVQVQQLEEALGVRLFDRTNRKVVLTKAGEDLLLPLERLLVDAETVMSRGKSLAALRRGLITVAAVPTIAATLLPETLHDFSEAYPGVTVQVRDDVAANFIELVRAGDVDIGIGGDIVDDRTIHTEPLFSDRICVFTPATHPLARKRRIELRELAGAKVILPAKSISARLILERAFEQQGLSIRPLFETKHVSTAMAMVNAGVGISVLPRIAFDCYPAGNVRRIPLVNPMLERRIVVASKAGRQVSPALEKFIEILRAKSALRLKIPRRAPVSAASARRLPPAR